MNPFVPLSIHPYTVTLIRIIPFPLALLWFCVTSSCITWWGMLHTKSSGFILACAVIPWIYSNIPIWQPEIPHWLGTIGHLALMLPHSINSQAGSFLIQYELDHLYATHPTITTVIMPESAWNGTALSTVNYLEDLNHPIEHIVIGGFCDRPTYTNRLYYFKSGALNYCHDKRHAVPVTERPISWLSLINNRLFFTQSPPICPGQNQRLPLQLPPIGLCSPYICSELFCNNWPDDHSNIPILTLVNDWWFSLAYFRQLMALAARLQAIKWQRPILYISFYYAQYFDQYGNSAPIATPTHCFI